MRISRLSEVKTLNLESFDCGDCDLNEFLVNDADLYHKELLAHTYVIDEDSEIIAYFSVMADKISNAIVPKNIWRKLRKKVPHEKHFNSYPALKIARLAVSKKYRGKNIGTNIILSIAQKTLLDTEFIACRFITVDAYKTAQEFYEKNDFIPLTNLKDPESKTIPMYWDLKEALLFNNESI